MWDFSKGRPHKIVDFGKYLFNTATIPFSFSDCCAIDQKMKFVLNPSFFIATALHDNHGGSTGQCFNPAYIHALAVPDIDMLDKSGKICTVARGDGAVDVIDVESELAFIKSKTSTGSQRGSQNRSKNRSRPNDTENSEQNGRKRIHLDYSFGGHTAAVSCV